MSKFFGGIKAGSTSVSIPVVLRKAADSTELTGIAFGSATVTYRRQGAASVVVTTSALGSIAAAYSSGGWFEADATNEPGTYRLDVPDAAFVAGADWVLVAVKTSTGFVFYERFALETQGAADAYALLTAVVALDTQGNPGVNVAEVNSGLATLAQGLDVNIVSMAGQTVHASAAVTFPAAVGTSTYAGGAVAGVTGTVNATLVPSGLDAVIVEGSVTVTQALRGFASALLAKVSGAGTGTVRFRNLADTKDRITATTTSDGNRSVVTTDLT